MFRNLLAWLSWVYLVVVLVPGGNLYTGVIVSDG